MNWVIVILVAVVLAVVLIAVLGPVDYCQCQGPVTADKVSRMVGVVGKGGHFKTYYVCQACGKDLE